MYKVRYYNLDAVSPLEIEEWLNRQYTENLELVTCVSGFFIFKEQPMDMYREIAAEALEISSSEVTQEERRQTKTILFGSMYGSVHPLHSDLVDMVRHFLPPRKHGEIRSKYAETS